MSIQVTAFLNPFSQTKSEFHFEEAISIQEIIKKLDALHAVNTGWRVLIDDEIVTDFTRNPKDGQHVYMKLVPEGDNEESGTGMKIGGALAVIGGIAAIVFLGWTGIVGVVGAALIGAGIGCFAGGMVLYNLDTPSVSTNKKKQETPEQDPSIRGSENQLRPYGMVPTLFGRRRIYADLAATSFTWAENGSIYLYQLFCAGQKDMTIDTGTIKIDETLLKDYSSSKDINTILAGNDPLIDMRIHQDGTMPVLYEKCVHEIQLNTILRHETEEGLDSSVIRTLPVGTQEINVDIFFYNGLGKYNDDGSVGTAFVRVEAWYKKSDEDDSAYQSLGYFKTPEGGETFTQTHSQNFIAFIEGSEPVTNETLWNQSGLWEYVDGEKFSVNIYDREKYELDITRVKDEEGNDSYSSGYTVWFTVSYTEILTTPINYDISGAELKTKRYSITKTGLNEKFSYTVKISRVSADSTDTKVIDDVYVGSVRAAKHVNPVQPERAAQLTLIELKIKASEKLNNVVKELNFIAEAQLPSYSLNGSGAEQWVYANSRNPASAAMYAMQGDFAQQKLADNDIDWVAFEKLYTWCQSHGYECNAYLTEQMSVSNLLSSIASTCRAEILRLNGKLTVIQDIERDSFTQLFTPRNSHGYSESIALSEIPDAQDLNFIDETTGYAENMVRIYNTPDGKYNGAPDTTQNVQLWGVTNSVQAQKIGMYNYAVTNHRFIIHKFNCDFEYLMCSKGDWIKYAGDLALAGITQGRITELRTDNQGKVIAFECDEEIPMESGKSYGMRVRKHNGETVIIYLENTGRSSKIAMLSYAIEAETSPQPGDLFTFGEVSGANLKDAIDLIITDIQCGENLSADLTCVEYSPEIFAVDEPNFKLPEFENHLSAVQGATDFGQVWQTFYTYHDGDETPGTPTGDGTNGGWHHVRTPESNWVSIKTAATIYDGVWGTPSYAKGPKGEPGAAGADGIGITVQYSTDSTNWHETFTENDLYMRQSTDGGVTWSNSIRIVGEKGETGNSGQNGESGWSVYCGLEIVELPCTANRKIKPTTTITIPFNAFQGTERKPAAISYSELPVGVTLASNTAATTESDGSLVLSVEENATLGGTTSAYDFVRITLTITSGGTAFTKYLTIKKSIPAVSMTASRDSLTFTIRRNDTTNYESQSVTFRLYAEGELVTEGVTASVSGATGATASGSLSDGVYTVTVLTPSGNSTLPSGHITVTMSVNGNDYTKEISLQSVVAGKYIGLATALATSTAGGTATIAADSSVNINASNMAASLGDYVVWKSSTTTSYTQTCVYALIRTGATSWAWSKDESDEANSVAFVDILSILQSDSSNATAVLLAQRFAANTAFITKLFAQYIKIQSGGSIRGGERYNVSGEIINRNKNGFWIGANGIFKGNLQSDNGNILLGDNAGLSLSSPSGKNGMYNIAVGQNVLKSATTAYHNVAIGTQALEKTTSGISNVAVGEQCLKQNTTGSENTVIGYGFIDNTTGSYNVGIGQTVGLGNTTGSENISIGNTITHGPNANQNILVGNSLSHRFDTGNVINKDDNVIIGNNITVGDSETKYSNNNIVIGRGISITKDTFYEADNNIFIGAWKKNSSDSTAQNTFSFPEEGDVPSGDTRKHFNAINIGDVFLSQWKFYLNAQKSITGDSGIRAALIKRALFEKGSGIWGRVYGVQDYSFGTSSGYIKYTNGLLIQWIFTSDSNSSEHSFSKTWPISFTSSNTYAVAGSGSITRNARDNCLSVQGGSKDSVSFYVYNMLNPMAIAIGY